MEDWDCTKGNLAKITKHQKQPLPRLELGTLRTMVKRTTNWTSTTFVLYYTKIWLYSLTSSYYIFFVTRFIIYTFVFVFDLRNELKQKRTLAGLHGLRQG